MAPRVLFVSKAVQAPWNDSSKNLVRDVHGALTRYEGTTLVATPQGRGSWAIYGAKSRFAPGLSAQVRVMGALLRERRHSLWHFFFAPNPKSGMAGRAAKALRRRPCVHTICSVPADPASLSRSLFADRTVVLSSWTQRLFESHGHPCVRIPPALRAPSVPTQGARSAARRHFDLGQQASVVVYAGDLEFGGGAELCLQACAPLDVQLVMACRTKTPAAEEERRRLQRLSAAKGVQWVGETSRILDLLGAADVVALPGTSTFAKMDYPLVLLEAMAMERAVVVGRGTAAEELEDGGALGAEADVDALRSSIANALSSAHQESGQARRDYVLNTFDAPKVAAAYEALYDEVLHS